MKRDRDTADLLLGGSPVGLIGESVFDDEFEYRLGGGGTPPVDTVGVCPLVHHLRLLLPALLDPAVGGGRLRAVDAARLMVHEGHDSDQVAGVGPEPGEGEAVHEGRHSDSLDVLGVCPLLNCDYLRRPLLWREGQPLAS